ncbi:hypothetical protein CTAM01_12204 [Colletotrichum tamarilloi]|uniref:Secreted protein n=1 Tax=Colletotrichum tamarilloi TaxID=1209934 RepID=A0ABQ9QVA9_9PEZI|nr:uncharacterized protein CTAM01_12204 [Colletotrichum tamarilloi]KAK1486323.1 hypothetical protein CTAM01_12204 [Colletotrichum tamarilloi]
MWAVLISWLNPRRAVAPLLVFKFAPSYTFRTSHSGCPVESHLTKPPLAGETSGNWILHTRDTTLEDNLSLYAIFRRKGWESGLLLPSLLIPLHSRHRVRNPHKLELIVGARRLVFLACHFHSSSGWPVS